MGNQTKLRVYVDFNSRDEGGNIAINVGTPAHEYLKAILVTGLSIVLFDETLEVEARVEWNKDFDTWVGVPDWQTIHHLI